MTRYLALALLLYSAVCLNITLKARDSGVVLRLSDTGDFVVGVDGYAQLTVDRVSVSNLRVQTATLTNVVAGTHSFEIQLKAGEANVGEPLLQMIDVYPPALLQLFPGSRQRLRRSLALQKNTKICFVSGPEQDGQKTLFAQQISHLDARVFSAAAIFYQHSGSGQYAAGLRRLPKVTLRESILTVPSDIASQLSLPELTLLLLEHLRSKSAPEWAIKFWGDLRSPLSDCSVVVLGNGRSETDHLVVAGAHSVGAKAVMELPNLHPPSGMLADAFVAPSRFVANHPSLALYKEKIAMIRPGVDLTRFYPAAQVHSSDVVKIGFVGRFAPEKGPGVFLRMASRLVRELPDSAPAVHFVMIGFGPLEAPLRTLCGKLGLAHLVTIESVPHHDMPRRMRELDVLVNPSLQPETFGIVNVEAIASGVAVVSFAVGGMGEAVRPSDTGVVVGESSLEALVDSVRGVVEDGALRRKLATRGREVAEEEFNLDDCIHEYELFYEELVAGEAP